MLESRGYVLEPPCRWPIPQGKQPNASNPSRKPETTKQLPTAQENVVPYFAKEQCLGELLKKRTTFVSLEFALSFAAAVAEALAASMDGVGLAANHERHLGRVWRNPPGPPRRSTIRKGTEETGEVGGDSGNVMCIYDLCV